MKSFCSSKRTTEGVKRQGGDWAKRFAIRLPNKGLPPRLCKEFSETERRQTTQQKNGQTNTGNAIHKTRQPTGQSTCGQVLSVRTHQDNKETHCTPRRMAEMNQANHTKQCGAHGAPGTAPRRRQWDGWTNTATLENSLAVPPSLTHPALQLHMRVYAQQKRRHMVPKRRVQKRARQHYRRTRNRKDSNVQQQQNEKEKWVSVQWSITWHCKGGDYFCGMWVSLTYNVEIQLDVHGAQTELHTRSSTLYGPARVSSAAGAQRCGAGPLVVLRVSFSTQVLAAQCVHLGKTHQATHLGRVPFFMKNF